MSLRAPRFFRLRGARSRRGFGRLAGVLVAAAVHASLPSLAQAANDSARTAAKHRSATRHIPSPEADHAVAQIGWASVYARKLAGRPMANGAPMRLDRHNAASLTLPLGSTALVTNLANGARVRVTITDRGPFVRGRIIDLTPHTAKVLGIGHLARVEVEPIAPASDRGNRVGLVLATADRDEAASPR